MGGFGSEGGWGGYGDEEVEESASGLGETV